MASGLPAAGVDAGGLCQALSQLLPVLPAQGQAGAQTGLGQQAAAT